MHLLSTVRQFVSRHHLIPRGSRVAVAVSGGPDSVALAHILSQLAAAGDLVVAGLVHFNHQLRPTAERDEAFCERLARRLAVPIEIGRGDVRGIASAERRSLEDAAHGARYEFFADARARLAADAVGLGHTRDDQAETFLLRLVHGAGARGLAAMHPRNGFIVRPLLGCGREEIVDYLGREQLEYVVDESNEDVSIPRNRVRLELMPLLRDRFNPKVAGALADAAEIARAEWDWLDESGRSALPLEVRPGEPSVDMDVRELERLPLALRRFVVWNAMSQLSARRVTFAHVEQVLRLAQVDVCSGTRVYAPGQFAERIADRLVLRVGTDRSAAKGRAANLFEYSLSIPGEVVVAEAGGIVSASDQPDSDVPEPEQAVVRRDLCGSRLFVRNRRPGDYLRPIGLGGRKKLQDLLVDRKVPRPQRDRIPLVVDETGRILWVAGFGISEEFRVTDPAQPMLILRFKVLGGRV